MIYSLWINVNGVVGINNNQSKWINSIGRYLNQNEKILTEFDEYVAFFDDLNTVSNSYKHSLCTFSPSKADGDIFISYTLKDSDVDKEISQNEIIETVEMNRLDWVPCKYAFFTTQNLVNRDHMGSIDFTGFFIKIILKMYHFRAIHWQHE